MVLVKIKVNFISLMGSIVLCDSSTTPKSEMLVGPSCFPSAAPACQVQLLVIAHTHSTAHIQLAQEAYFAA